LSNLFDVFVVFPFFFVSQTPILCRNLSFLFFCLQISFLYGFIFFVGDVRRYILFFLSMQTFDFLPSGSLVTNLSDISTEKSLEVASLCESVKISVTNLTPCCSAVTIPVRVNDCVSVLPIEYLEEVVCYGVASKKEFRYLRKLCALLNS
jgi:hypothetical protein